MKNPDDKARKLYNHLQTVMREAESLDKKNASELSSQEVRVLRAVGRQDCCIMSGIADAICLSLSSVTGLIDRLVEKRLVKRDRSTDDRRVVQVMLTDKGKEVNEQVMEKPLAFSNELLKGLTGEEQEALLALFGKIAARIDKEKEA